MTRNRHSDRSLACTTPDRRPGPQTPSSPSSPSKTREPIPDSHQLEQIAENSASLLRFVKRRERGRGGPATAGGEGRGWLPRVHVPLGEGRGRDHFELRRRQPGFRESEIDGMNGEGGRLSRRLGGRPKCRAASGDRGRRRNRSAQPPGRSPSGTLGRTTRSPTANHRRQCPAAARSAARRRRSRRVSRAAIAARSSR